MSAVTPDDLLTYLGKTTFPGGNAQEDAAQMVLDGLQGEIEAYLGRPIEVRNFVEEYPVDPSVDEPDLVLRQTPVSTLNEVTEVTVYGQSTTETVVDPAYYTKALWGVQGLIYYTPTFPFVVRVDYDAGLDLTLPEHAGIKLAILKAAAKWYFSFGDSGVTAESAGGAISSLSTDGGYSVKYTGAGGLHSSGADAVGSFSPGELKAIDRYRRKA